MQLLLTEYICDVTIILRLGRDESARLVAWDECICLYIVVCVTLESREFTSIVDIHNIEVVHYISIR